MSEITDIRSRQIISLGGSELIAVISAALSGAFALHQDGEFTLEPWESGLSPAGEIFRSAFFGRKFANLESVAACVIDTGIEQIMLHEDGAYLRPVVEVPDDH